MLGMSKEWTDACCFAYQVVESGEKIESVLNLAEPSGRAVQT